jgi:hypothetical protein
LSNLTDRDDLVYCGPYSLQAHGLSFLSRGSDTASRSADINIMAEGAGPTGEGSVNLHASTHISLHSAGGLLALSSGASNSIVVRNDDPGNTTIVQGTMPGSPALELSGGAAALAKLAVGLPGLGSSIDLKADGMSLRFGPGGAGAALELDGQGVRLSFGLGSLKMDTAGIELTFGPNKIALGPQGVSIDGIMVDLKAKTRMAVQGLALELKAQAVFQAGGAITLIG